VQFEDAGKISAEAMHEKRESDGKAQLVTNAACFGCTIACGRISEIDKGHFTVKNSPKYWARPAVWSTRPPGRWAQPTVWAISKPCSMPT
jgi:aldehyde:ferredoxin oxidoreductase